jgi:hypothetical protein
MILKHDQPTKTYFNEHHRLHIVLLGQFVLKSQGPLNLCCSVNNQFSDKQLKSVQKEGKSV